MKAILTNALSLFLAYYQNDMSFLYPFLSISFFKFYIHIYVHIYIITQHNREKLYVTRDIYLFYIPQIKKKFPEFNF